MPILPSLPPDALPQQSTYERFFFVQKYSFATIGIDPTSLRRTIFNPMTLVLPLIAITTVLGPSLLFARTCAMDLNEVARVLTPILQCILAIVKISLFVLQKEKIVKLVRYVWIWNIEANAEELLILREENRYDQIISGFYYGSAIISGFSVTLLPFVIALFYAWKGNSFWQSLYPPFKGVYIMDTHASYIGFLFAFIWDVLAIYCTINASLAIDSLFSWFMRNIVALFRILDLRLRMEAIRHDLFKSEEQFKSAISECVKYHLRVIKLAESFNEVYRNIIFFKFLISSVQIALIVFQFPYTKEVAIQLMNVSFMISLSTQLMLYCHGGQKIKDVSSSIDLTIYECFQWPDFSVKLKKLLLLPMMGSLKPCHVTGIFFVADLSLFVWVFKSAGSFLTMMLSMYQSDD
ncbi:odorant receptor 45a-like [Haematobia irritans]|uniref:odorant receptor 45a-like n=1 Tax=Haematobia irritans TaxID=7368 RepID=UPI003F4F5D36